MKLIRIEMVFQNHNFVITSPIILTKSNNTLYKHLYVGIHKGSIFFLTECFNIVALFTVFTLFTLLYSLIEKFGQVKPYH